ncbi:MAG: DUF535 family protein [Chitinophagaceae bacterium]
MSLQAPFYQTAKNDQKPFLSFLTETAPFAQKHFFRVLQMAKHIRQHMALVKVLEPMKELPLISKRTSFIYMLHYVSRNMNIKTKLNVLTHHYQFLQEIFPKTSIEKLFDKGIECWSTQSEGDKLSVRLAHSGYLEFEGSLSLFFYVNDKPISTMSFTFAPGHSLGMPDDKVIFVSLLQGKVGEWESISKATKMMNDLIPSTILMSVVEGIALALGIKNIVGICAKHQLSKETVTDAHANNYDNYWISQGGIQTEEGNFQFSCPLPNKPIEQVKAKYRGRTLTKRAKRAEVANETTANFLAATYHPYTRRLITPTLRPAYLQKESIPLRKVS